MGEEENWRTVSLFVRLEDSATEGPRLSRALRLQLSSRYGAKGPASTTECVEHGSASLRYNPHTVKSTGELHNGAKSY